jgi:hypothetical protein
MYKYFRLDWDTVSLYNSTMLHNVYISLSGAVINHHQIIHCCRTVYYCISTTSIYTQLLHFSLMYFGATIEYMYRNTVVCLYFSQRINNTDIAPSYMPGYQKSGPEVMKLCFLFLKLYSHSLPGGYNTVFLIPSLPFLFGTISWPKV